MPPSLRPRASAPSRTTTRNETGPGTRARPRPSSLARMFLLNRAGLTFVDGGARDGDGLGGLFVFGLGLVDGVHHVHAAGDAAEGGELAVELRGLADEDEEVRGRAVRLV